MGIAFNLAFLFPRMHNFFDTQGISLMHESNVCVLEANCR